MIDYQPLTWPHFLHTDEYVWGPRRTGKTVDIPAHQAHARRCDYTIEVQSLGCTLKRWNGEIVAWHSFQAMNAPAEAMNNLIKGAKRIAFGFVNFR